MESPNITADVLGHEETDCGVELFDENGNRHIVTVEWDGTIQRHSQESYPHETEDRTDEQQRIMSQVEERARFEAQREFEDADILDPMWDPDHLQQAIDALSSYPMDQFAEDFEDFYEATRAPQQVVRDPDMNTDTVTAIKLVRCRDGDVLDVADVVLQYERTDGTGHEVGDVPHYPDDELLALTIPHLDYEPDATFPEDFAKLVLTHLHAQIRDIYWNMGEEAPPEYRVEGIGKRNIIGDDTGPQ